MRKKQMSDAEIMKDILSRATYEGTFEYNGQKYESYLLQLKQVNGKSLETRIVFGGKRMIVCKADRLVEDYITTI